MQHTAVPIAVLSSRQALGFLVKGHHSATE